MKIEEEYKALLEKNIEICRIEKEKVIGLGGLLIIGTEHNLYKELDESLRQHAGIQGDVGECVFYLSLQDRIFVAFDVSEELICNATNLGADDINPFMDLSVTMLVNNLQNKMGQFRIERLEQSLFFDDIIQERRKIKDETKSRLFEIEDMLPIITHGVEVLAKDISKKSVDDINLVLEPSIFPKGLNFVKEEDEIELRNKKIVNKVSELLEESREIANSKGINIQELIRNYFIIGVNKYWGEYLDNMRSLWAERKDFKNYSFDYFMKYFKGKSKNLFNAFNKNALVCPIFDIFSALNQLKE